MRLRGLLARLLLLCGGALPLQALALEQVTLQLKWKHQFQFAGYYAALEQGYYRRAGLDVRIVEAEPDQDTVAQVLQGRAQYGVGHSNLALLRSQGKPVVVLAVILQHSPYVYIARGGIDHVHELVGKRVMQEQQGDELFAYLHKEGVHPRQLQLLPHSFSAADLLAGRVDAISAYSSDELFEVRASGQPHTVLTPRSAGIDFYGDNLYTTEEEIRHHPQRVRAFREASLLGWQYAMAHPQEMAEAIHKRWGRRHSREHLLFEAAEMQRLMQPELVEIGHMNPGRWHHIAETYQELGMLDGTRLDGFLYDPEERPDRSRLVAVLGLFVAATVVLGLIVGHLRRLNLRLSQREQALREAHAALQLHVCEIEGLQSRLQEPALRERAEFWRCSVEAMVVTTHAGAAFGVTVSVGVAVFPTDAPDVRTLQRSADRALYRAKQKGRNRVEFALPAGEDESREEGRAVVG